MNGAFRRATFAVTVGLAAAACGDGHGVVAASAPAPSSRAALVNALAGTWQATLAKADGAASPGTLTLAIGARPGQVATACGNYDMTAMTLHPSCMTTYSLVLNGSLTTDDGVFAQVPFSGSIDCWSPSLTEGDVFLRFDDGTTADLTFDTAAGFSNGTLRASSAGSEASLALRR